MQESQVLVLNASCEPLQLTAVQRAVQLILSARAEIVTAGAGELRSARCTIARPVVIRLRRYVHVPYQDVACTRKGILLRDGYTCQYCGATPAVQLLTLDHVVPRALGGRSTWENMVAACRACNARKADQPLHVARMTLRSMPRQPARAWMLRYQLARHPAWQQYIFV